MATTPLAPLSMSQKKEDLLRHLNISADAYAVMSKEVDQVYTWLTSDKQHLKRNCKRKPPYDWSDILENKKDEAIQMIALSGSDQTQCYWNLAIHTAENPNWIAKWFLYHKFRYRDGRNRNSTRTHGGGRSSHHKSSSSSWPSHQNTSGPSDEGSQFDASGSVPYAASGSIPYQSPSSYSGYSPNPPPLAYQPFTGTIPAAPGYQAVQYTSYQYPQGYAADDNASKTAFDPIRDV